jgi:hypothetical protein
MLNAHELTTLKLILLWCAQHVFSYYATYAVVLIGNIVAAIVVVLSHKTAYLCLQFLH